MSPEVLRQRLTDIIRQRYGRVEEELMGSGLLDSLRAVELALALEGELGLPPDRLALKDLSTLTALTRKVSELRSEADRAASG